MFHGLAQPSGDYVFDPPPWGDSMDKEAGTFEDILDRTPRQYSTYTANFAYRGYGPSGDDDWSTNAILVSNSPYSGFNGGLKAGGAGTYHVAFIDDDRVGPDAWVEAEWNGSNSTVSSGFMLRFSRGANVEGYVITTTSNGNNVRLYTALNGGLTQIATFGANFVQGDRMRLEFNGPNYFIYKNNSQVTSGSDFTYTSGDYVGFYKNANDNLGWLNVAWGPLPYT